MDGKIVPGVVPIIDLYAADQDRPVNRRHILGLSFMAVPRTNKSSGMVRYRVEPSYPFEVEVLDESGLATVVHRQPALSDCAQIT
jgi:hypothetical protein